MMTTPPAALWVCSMRWQTELRSNYLLSQKPQVFRSEAFSFSHLQYFAAYPKRAFKIIFVLANAPKLEREMSYFSNV